MYILDIDKHHTPCGGSHTWEDHKAALQKFGPPKGKGNSNEKGGKAKGKGKGKGKDKAHSLTEGQQEGQVDEDTLLGFLEASNWWSGESISALTEARHSGEHASASINALEPECCSRRSAVSINPGQTCC